MCTKNIEKLTLQVCYNGCLFAENLEKKTSVTSFMLDLKLVTVSPVIFENFYFLRKKNFIFCKKLDWAAVHKKWCKRYKRKRLKKYLSYKYYRYLYEKRLVDLFN